MSGTEVLNHGTGLRGMQENMTTSGVSIHGGRRGSGNLNGGTCLRSLQENMTIVGAKRSRNSMIETILVNHKVRTRWVHLRKS